MKKNILKEKKVPLRRCVATNEQLPKKELIRVVRTPSGEVEIDLIGKMNGRGAYLKKSSEAVLLAKKKKILDRHLEVVVNDEIFEKLLEIINSENE